ncbi:MAG: ATPase [Prevotellaceae bacterium]|nr:ATPase [Prevotellaceae bacterium]
MILIADSGSTKTDWCVVEDGKLLRQVYTKGMNPFFQSKEEMGELIRHSLLNRMDSKQFDEVHFYGAGCIPEKIPILQDVLNTCLEVSGTVEVASDMLGAARGLCGREAGIVCILGTGSNSCFYDGEKIAANVSPLGFILGDEGSGAVLGKIMVANILKNQTSARLKEKFLTQYNLTQAEIIERVYRGSFPNRFLASTSLFVAQNIEEPEMHDLAFNAFKSFFERNVKQYDYQHHQANLMGSIAFYYKAVIREAAAHCGIEVGAIVQSPMSGLIKYHS